MRSVFDALLVLSFGGPEGPQDVRPFLENVTRGRGVPPERLDAVEEHYRHFGGVSPLNARNRELIAAVRKRTDLPVYFGNRNWHPTGRGHGRGDGPRRRPPRPGVRHQRVRRLLGVPPVPRGHRAGPCGGGGGRAGAGAAAALLRPPAVRRGQRRRGAGRVRAGGGPGSRRCPAGVHRAFRADRGGRGGRAARRRAGTATRGRSPRRRGSSRRRWGSSSTTSCGSPGRDRRRCRGWPRTSSTTSTRCTRRARRRWSSPRWGSCPTTSRSCGTWTPRPGSGRQSWAWASPGRRRPAPIPRFADMVVELMAEHTADAPPRRLSGIPGAGCTVNGLPCAPDCCVSRPRPPHPGESPVSPR